MIKELEEFNKFPHVHHADEQDVLAQGGVFGAAGIAIYKNILTAPRTSRRRAIQTLHGPAYI